MHDAVIPEQLPETGFGESEAFDVIASLVRERSAQLGDPVALAHMDPAPATVAARLVGLNAEFNQNLLHPDLSPFATDAEARVIQWLCPYFDMSSGHMCAGSTIANLAALWCAREHGATHVAASPDAHISVPKAASILGLPFETLPIDEKGRVTTLDKPLQRDTALVLTAGTTGRGVIDCLHFTAASRRKAGQAAWVHVDAAWAGPMRLTKYARLLDGIEHADSVSISAHKWFFQPKDSALVLFADPAAQKAISFGGAYLAKPNVGVQGSRSAAGVALLGTLLAWGKQGLAERIDRCISISEQLAERLKDDPRALLKQEPETAVVNWQPTNEPVETVLRKLGPVASKTTIGEHPWIRQVATNMYADIEMIWSEIDRAI